MTFQLGLPHLLALGLSAGIAQTYIKPLQEAFAKFSIGTESRAACFMGQCQVESQNFSVLEENLFYTTPQRILDIFHDKVKTLADATKLARNPQALANVVYAGKGGNGDAASGDGWRYHGRGPIQTTTLNNYVVAEKGCGRPYVLHPELLLTPEDGCLAAAFFWSSNGLNELADKIPTGGVKPTVDQITRRVNRASLEADKRLRLTQKALGVFQTLA